MRRGDPAGLCYHLKRGAVSEYYETDLITGDSGGHLPRFLDDDHAPSTTVLHSLQDQLATFPLVGHDLAAQAFATWLNSLDLSFLEMNSDELR